MIIEVELNVSRVELLNPNYSNLDPNPDLDL
jgi:hypothetical protein